MTFVAINNAPMVKDADTSDMLEIFSTNRNSAIDLLNTVWSNI